MTTRTTHDVLRLPQLNQLYLIHKISKQFNIYLAIVKQLTMASLNKM
jgi:hypothetical protein